MRRAHPALQQLRDIHFHHTDNDQVIAYSKTRRPQPATPCWWCARSTRTTPSRPTSPSTCRRWAPDWGDTLVVHDEISGATFHWGQFAFVRLEPWRAVAHSGSAAPA